MSFAVPADAYDRFMGRYSRLLSPQLADVAGVSSGQRVLDVGCGPGALTAELVSRLGSEGVVACDPAESFVGAARERFPEVEIHQAPAEELPFPDDTFDAALAQLVVHFMADPVKGVTEMGRVTRPGGVVATCVWDMTPGHTPLGPLWEAAREIDPDVEGESARMGTTEGDLTELFTQAGLREIEESALSVSLEHPTFEAWWEPFELGVGPSGAYVAGLDPDHRARLREQCRRMLPDPPFVLTARAWTARGLA